MNNGQAYIAGLKTALFPENRLEEVKEIIIRDTISGLKSWRPGKGRKQVSALWPA